MCNNNILLHHKLPEWTSLHLALQDSTSHHRGHQHLLVGSCYLSSSDCRAENISVPCPLCTQVRIAWATFTSGLGDNTQRYAEGWRAPRPIGSAVALMAALKLVGAVKLPVIPAACKRDNSLYRTGVLWKQEDWSQQALGVTVKGTTEGGKAPTHIVFTLGLG